MLRCVNKALVRCDSERKLINSICKIGTHIGEYLMVWIGYIHQENEVQSVLGTACSGFDEDISNIGPLRLKKFDHIATDPVGKLFGHGELITIDNLKSDSSHDQPLFKMAIEQGAGSAIGLPMSHKNKIFGSLILFSSQSDLAAPVELNLLKELSENLYLGITNLRARSEQDRLQNAVIEIARGVSSGSGIEFFQELTRHLVQALQADVGCIAMLNGPENKSVTTIALIVDGKLCENMEYQLAGNVCENVFGHDVLVIPRDLVKLYPKDHCLSKWGMTAYAGIPLIGAGGKHMGVLNVAFKKTIDYQDFIVSTIKIFASRANGELQRQLVDAQIREQASLIDKANDAILLLDLENHIRLWNASAEHIYGWNRDEVLGQSMVKILGIDQGIFDNAIQELFLKGEWFGELATKNKVGKCLIIDCSWTLISNESGQPHSIFFNVYSEPRKGTQFNIYLPAGQHVDSIDKMESNQVGNRFGQGELILIVDDEESIRIASKSTLERFGYRTLCASHGAEAVVLYAKYQDDIAVVLTYISMPVMDGNALIMALHNMNPNVQIIASSGLPSKDAINELAGSKVCCFLPKPYMAKAILDALATVLTAP